MRGFLLAEPGRSSVGHCGVPAAVAAPNVGRGQDDCVRVAFGGYRPGGEAQVRRRVSFLERALPEEPLEGCPGTQ